MKPYRTTFALACALAIQCATPTFAATIFSNVAANNVYNSTIGGLSVDPTFDDGLGDPTQDGQAVAQLFTSTGNYTVTQIDIGLVFQEGDNAAVISLWTDNAGQPGTELGSWNEAGFPGSGSLSTPTAPFTGGQVISGITGVTLSAGQSYFLEAGPAAQDGNPMNDIQSDLTWFEETTTDSQNSYYQSLPGTTWSHAGDPDGAYAIFGNVAGASAPEPSSILLFTGGLTGLLVFARKRRPA